MKVPKFLLVENVLLFIGDQGSDGRGLKITQHGPVPIDPWEPKLLRAITAMTAVAQYEAAGGDLGDTGERLVTEIAGLVEAQGEQVTQVYAFDPELGWCGTRVPGRPRPLPGPGPLRHLDLDVPLEMDRVEMGRPVRS
jgi:hypothetical protein